MDDLAPALRLPAEPGATLDEVTSAAVASLTPDKRSDKYDDVIGENPLTCS